MFQFEVYGIPVAQKQTQFGCSCPANKKCKKWGYDPSLKDKQTIQWQIKPFAPETPFDSAIEMTVAFFLPIPKGVSKAVKQQMINRVILPDKKPDDDNLSYLITNSLKGIVYDDDKRVCARHIYKFYGEEPKTVIRVRPILQAQPLGFRDADDIR
jgi:Holliday junction resolvase RusA-like endonuclease